MKRDTPNPTTASGKSTDRYLVPGLVRGLSVLKLFTPDRPVLRLGDFAAALGITRSAAFRTAYTLTEMGCLLHDEASQTYSLGPGVLRLSYGYVAAREIAEIAQPELERLRSRTGWSAHMGVLEGVSVIYVLRAAAAHGDVSIVHVGRRLPARSTTMGRVLLADLPEEDLIEMFRADSIGATKGKGPPLTGILAQAAADRDKEVIIHSGNFEAGIVSAAAPIRGMTGRVVAAINVTHVISAEAEDALHGPVRADLLATAKRISSLIGYEPPL
jgi:IclR family pca regulon transcriptional regulator